MCISKKIGFGYSEKLSNLKDKDWILTLAVLVDISYNLNVLNLSLQEKNILFHGAIYNMVLQINMNHYYDLLQIKKYKKINLKR